MALLIGEEILTLMSKLAKISYSLNACSIQGFGLE